MIVWSFSNLDNYLHTISKRLIKTKLAKDKLRYQIKKMKILRDFLSFFFFLYFWEVSFFENYDFSLQLRELWQQ